MVTSRSGCGLTKETSFLSRLLTGLYAMQGRLVLFSTCRMLHRCAVLL